MSHVKEIIQRQTEWLELSDAAMDYHKNQFQNIYRSTISFCDWLEHCKLFESDIDLEIADIGAGAGSNIYYMSERFPKIKFTGFELNPDLVKFGNYFFEKNNKTNCNLINGNLYEFDENTNTTYDGVVSLQTLSWLPEFKNPLKKMANLRPDWIALTSLFYDGEVDIKVEIKDYTKPRKNIPYVEGYYNIYPIPHVKDYFKELGYTHFVYKKFDIDIDIPKPKNKGLGTYTEQLKDGSLIQISAGILMSWYFILASK
jgi:hypothetical protein